MALVPEGFVPLPVEEDPAFGRGHGELTFDRMYLAWFSHVCRWLRAYGVRMADLDDVAQEVFLVALHKLPTFEPTNVPGWLYAIARRTASDYRRRAYIKYLFGQRVEIDTETWAVEDATSPEDAAVAEENRRLVSRVLHRMTAKRRAAFVLFEIEGYSCEEIATFEEVPVATVWMRLHHARKEFFAVARSEQKRLSREVP